MEKHIGSGIIDLQENHTYIITFHIKGKSSRAPSNFGWAQSMGWVNSGTGLNPTPSNISKSGQSANFEGEKDCYYKFTVNDSIVKVCQKNPQEGNWIVGNKYLSYQDFMFGYGYGDTGPFGTDIYLSNFRMFDITDYINQNPGVTIDGILNALEIQESSIYDNASIRKTKQIRGSEFLEI